MDKSPANYSAVDQSDDPEHWINMMLEFPRLAPEIDRMRAEMLEWLSPLKSGVVIDAGCGPGYTTYEAACKLNPNLEIVGIDLSECMIDYGRANFSAPNLRFEQASLEALPFEDASVDAIRAERCLHHIANVDGCFSEFRRVLKPGGMLVINEPDLRYVCVNPLSSQFNGRFASLFGRKFAYASIGGYLPEWLNTYSFDQVDNHPHLLTITDADGIERFFDGIDTVRELCREVEDISMLNRLNQCIAAGTFYMAVPMFSVLATRR